MKKRIPVSVVWAIALPVAYAIASVVMFGVLGLIFKDSLQNPPQQITGWWTVLTVTASAWAWLFWASPVIGFVLAYFHRLPGTRKNVTLPRYDA